MEQIPLDGRHFRTAFVLLLVAAISSLFLSIVWPFLQPLLLAAILSSLCSPLFNWLTRLCGGRRSLAASLTLVLLFLIVAGPVSGFVGVVVSQAVSISNEAIPWVQKHFQAAGGFQIHDWLVKRFPSMASFVPDQAKIMESVGNTAKTAGGFLVSGVTQMTAGTATFLLNLFVMVYSMFFFLKDGNRILEKIFYYMPLRHEDEVRMLDRLTSVTRATVKGTLVIGLIQGALAGIAFWIAGIGGWAFWGTVMVVLSIVPGIGAALVWVPAVIYLFISGQNLAGTLLGIWCAAVVGTVDNVLRPALVGKDAQMPDLLILIGTLGGLYLFGPIGFIIGPVACGLFLTAWDIYGTTFKSILPPVKSLGSGKVKPVESMLDDSSPTPDKENETPPVKPKTATRSTTRKRKAQT